MIDLQSIYIYKIFVTPSSNLLEGTGDDEISVVHGNKIGGELAREVVLLFKLLPVNIGIRVLCFLKCMGYGTLHKVNKEFL